ncbi:MAG: FlgD immunoglobulin-like domain containing protein, partial [bacterium]
PAASWLRQNAPNPFRPSTSIAFGIPDAGNVHLRIFDTAGRLVRTLVDEPRAAGRWAEPWDGRDAAGRPVAAGVYLYRLEASGEGGRSVDETRKMTLLR